MPKIWIINQFANSPDLPGHTRQYDIAKYLVKIIGMWKFSLILIYQRCYTKLKKFQIKKLELLDGINWHWIWAFSYKKNNWKRYLNLLSFCIFYKINIFKQKIKNPDIILASSPQLPAAFVCLLLAKIFQKRFVLEIRDLWPQVLLDQNDRNKYSLFIKILTFIERKVYEGAEVVIVLAKGTENYVKQRGAKDNLAPNGPDLNILKEKIWLMKGKDLVKKDHLIYFMQVLMVKQIIYLM